MPEEIHLDPIEEEGLPVAPLNPPTAEALLKTYISASHTRNHTGYNEWYVDLWIAEMEELIMQAGITNEEFKAMVYARECNSEGNSCRA